MKSANKKFKYDENEDLFKKTFYNLNKGLTNGITRGRTTTPFNLFEAVSVGAALALKNTGHIVTDGLDNWFTSSELRDLTSGATNSRVRVKERIEYCKSKFEGR